MIAEIFKPNAIFNEIFEDIKWQFPSSRPAYNYTEKIFAHRCQQSFGIYAFAYSSFESFQKEYHRITGTYPKVY